MKKILTASLLLLFLFLLAYLYFRNEFVILYYFKNSDLLKSLVVLIISAGVIFIIYFFIYYQPKHISNRMRSIINGKTPFERETEIIESENNIRKTNAQIFGGIILLLGAYATFENVKIIQEKNEVDIYRNSSTLTGINNANGTPNLSVRIGGLYSLSRLSKISPDNYFWPVMELVSSYIKENSKICDKKLIRGDIQAAINIIGDRNTIYEEEFIIDLKHTNMCGYDFSGRNFMRINFTGAKFSYSVLLAAKFDNSILEKTSFYKSNMQYTSLVKALLLNTDFTNADKITPEQIQKANIQGPITIDCEIDPEKILKTAIGCN